MTLAQLLYLACGLVLVAALTALAVHYYSGKRREDVERAKHAMLDDD